jgi:hypothetical protein
MERLRVLPGRPCCKGLQARHCDGEDRGGSTTTRRARSSATREKVALKYVAAITNTHRDVDDELFARLQRHYYDDDDAELTMIIAWQNASSRFNRAFRIPSREFWKRLLERTRGDNRMNKSRDRITITLLATSVRRALVIFDTSIVNVALEKYRTGSRNRRYRSSVDRNRVRYCIPELRLAED